MKKFGTAEGDKKKKLNVYFYVPIDCNVPTKWFLENDMDIPLTDPCLFRFEMFRREAKFGDTTIVQFWMKPSTIYGNTADSVNHKSLIGCFWCLFRRAQKGGETHIDIDATLETYLLASLLPEMRTNGSRKIFMDQVPQGTWKTELSTQYTGNEQDIIDLNTLIKNANGTEESKAKFYELVGKALGRESYDAETVEAYVEFSDYLFGKKQGKFNVAPEPGLDAVAQRWQQWMDNYGRHRGNEHIKTVLNMLSYEARAAVHRCYAAVWGELLPMLQERFNLTMESVFFHQLWHRDHIVEATDSEKAFHLLHGHIFALHPATSFFVKTDAGRRLIDDMIKEGVTTSESHTAFHRFLAGYRVAVFDYVHYIIDVADKRKMKPNSMPDDVLIHEYEGFMANSYRRERLGSRSGQ